MFRECSSLSSLNLSNFNTSKVTSMNSMFYGCENLEYININISKKINYIILNIIIKICFIIY